MTVQESAVLEPQRRIAPSLESAPAPLRIVVASVSSDSHTWNLVFIQLLLEDMGHEVINLGACPPDELIIEECRRHRPDILVISSVNGHGHIDGERLIRRMRSCPDMEGLPAVIGGKLGIRGAENIAYSEGLLTAGFNAVFEASTGTQTFENYVLKLSCAREKNTISLTCRHEFQ